MSIGRLISSSQLNRRAFIRSSLLAAMAVAPFALRAQSNAAKPTDFTAFLRSVLAETGLPAIAAGAMRQGSLLALGAVGVRKVSEKTPVSAADKFHIGSDTKAMTASVAAMFVEQKKLDWKTTLANVFPERASKMDEGFRRITLEMLLTHRAGLPHDGNYAALPNVSIVEQRLACLDSLTSSAPKNLGEFAYSNAGYIIAGAMLERVSGKQWEDLMKERLFNPLRMRNAGFGPPSLPNQTDQPWGHLYANGRFTPRYGDNPPVLGPAGTVHCSVEDYLKFAEWHASEGARPPGLLSKTSFEKLHTPAKAGYAMGWGVTSRPWAKGTALTHAGSNTMNYFVVWVAPRIQFALAVASNCAGDSVPKVLDKVAGELVQRFAA